MGARILIADDSATTRGLLRRSLRHWGKGELVGEASRGDEAVRMTLALKPDLLILDIEMPGLDGLEALAQIRTKAPQVPVLMFSSLCERTARSTTQALLAGARDYLLKPSVEGGLDEALRYLEQSLFSKLDALLHLEPQRKPAAIQLRPRSSFKPPELIVIGVSTGGPAALEALLSQLSAPFRVPIAIVQHMPSFFTRSLAETLGRKCKLVVREAAEGAVLQAGEAVIAAGDWHLQLERKPGGFVQRLTQGAPENYCRPAVDVTLRSVADLGPGLQILILTGMGEDGLRGSQAAVAKGASLLAQDAASSVVWGMPGAVARAGLVEQLLDLKTMARELQRRCGAGMELQPGPAAVLH